MSSQTQSQNVIQSIFQTPFGLINSFIGVRKVQIQESVNMFRLGKECPQCKKPLVHRDSISVCQCYCFSHKDCLKNQLNKIALSECSVISCKTCKNQIQASLNFQFAFKPRLTVKNILILLVCILICASSIVYIINFKNYQKQERQSQQIRTHHKQYIPLITIQQVIALSLIFIFGTLFWLSLVGMLIEKKTNIQQIAGTNIEIKVSAFQDIEIKIRQESQQQILLKKEQIDL